MRRLRRTLPAFAALLAVIVAVQATDLVACADEAEAAEHAGQTHVDSFAGGGHPAPAPGDSHDEHEGGDEGGTFADCLCHVVFAPTAIVPTAEVDCVPEPADFSVAVATPPEVEPLGLDHVPLA